MFNTRLMRTSSNGCLGSSNFTRVGVSDMFIVRDYKQKILMKCNSRDGVLMAIITFSGLFGVKKGILKSRVLRQGKR